MNRSLLANIKVPSGVQKLFIPIVVQLQLL